MMIKEIKMIDNNQDKLIQKFRHVTFDQYDELGPVRLGTSASYTWRHDPKHILFSLARYKFCSKMLAGKELVLEVGCGDSFCVPIMLQTVGRMHGVDLEDLIIAQNKDYINQFPELRDRYLCEAHDMLLGPLGKKFDAAFCLDVIEHIPCDKEDLFVRNICQSLVPQGVLIIGTPNVTADQYASPISRAGHINLKSSDRLRELAARHFHNVFSFSMNDEVVHTGYSPMAHFIIVMGVGVKQP
jgi:2-polyprenyl-3-methyl-5-hydroxy-6-metoxy-1,4-benzoquinol methylase